LQLGGGAEGRIFSTTREQYIFRAKRTFQEGSISTLVVVTAVLSINTLDIRHALPYLRGPFLASWTSHRQAL